MTYGICASCNEPNTSRPLYCPSCWAPLVQKPPDRTASHSLTVETTPRENTAPLGAFLDTYTDRALDLARAGVILAFSLAVFVRFFRLDDVPLGLMQAETIFQETAAAIIDQQVSIGFWTEFTNGQPLGSVYILAGWTAALGNSVQEIRLLSAFAGLMTVAFMFFFCRSLFGFRTGVAASLLLALSIWHLSYSRMALPVVWLPLVEMISAYALLKALEEDANTNRQRWLLILAGTAMGSGIYYHNAFLIFVAAVTVFWIREFLASDQQIKSVLKGAAIFFAMAILVALPYLLILASNSGQAATVINVVAVSSTQEYQELSGGMEKSRYLIGRFNSRLKTLLQSTDDLDSEGESTRLIDPVTTLLAVIGLLLAMRRWKERNYAFLLILTFTAIAATGLTADIGVYARLTVATPALFAAAGITITLILRSMKGRVPDMSAVAAITALCSFIAIYNLTSLYGHPTTNNEILWHQVGTSLKN